MKSDHIGQRLGNYRLVDLLGVGVLTKVYLGEHLHLHTLAAIKVLDISLDHDNTSVFSFTREVDVIFRLNHPNIIRVLDFGVEQGSVAYFIVTYAPGGAFPRSYPKGSHLLPGILLPYVRQLCSALQYAHDKGVAHRNVRPEHIFLGDNNQVLLDHFGSGWVNLLSDERSLAGDRWKETSAADSLAYQAPEQIIRHPSPASDQYALGVVVYEWLSGERPFKGTGLEIAQQHGNMLPPALHEKLPAISPQLEQVVLKALAKDPRQRFPQMRDFATAFERACLSEQAPLTPSTEFQPVSQSHALMRGSISTGRNLFFFYSHKDEKLRNELAKQLVQLKRNGLIADWYDRNIDTGAEWAREIDTHLSQADIILLLVSPDFIASDYCYNLEIMRALERYESGESFVIPIILRPVSWKETPFGKLQVLPEGGKAVTTWANRDEAFLHIAEGIRKVVEKLNEKTG